MHAFSFLRRYFYPKRISPNYVFLSKYRGKLWILAILGIIVLLIWVGYRAVWTGFDGKNLWDWMELFLVPAVLGGAIALYNRAVQKAERERTQDNQRQQTLVNYFDQMQELLLKHNLRDPEKGKEARIVAKARTISTLKNLNGPRIAQLLRFLTEAELGGDTLLEINLDQVDLEGEDLSKVDLRKASLFEANLKDTLLDEADLERAILINSNLQNAFLYKTNCRWARLQRTDLRKASTREADFRNARLNTAKLQGAKLGRTKLNRAILKKAKLQGAYLNLADLQGAELNEANLQKAKCITIEQLEKAKSLEGATMPNGMKYEDWVAKGKPDWNKAEEDSEESSD